MTDLHAYVLKQAPDFVAVQEAGPEVGDLRRYNKYVLGCDEGSSRGMVMYIKSGISCTFKDMGRNVVVGDGRECRGKEEEDQGYS